jgi:transaldolase/glucose-6-phosphate isomerase
VEQLIAESTGKNGHGILPVVGEPLGPVESYGHDRLFVALQLGGHEFQSEALHALQEGGHPVVRLQLRGRYDLGAQVFTWEMATAVAGYHLGINPFDQPNVEAAKVRARDMVSAYHETGALPRSKPAPLSAAKLRAFLAQLKPGDYVALQAYVAPTAQAADALQSLRLRLRDRLKVATTWGFGPRFLHSTGQLHKGDAGNGLFIQLTADAGRDVPIPEAAGSASSTMTFGVLEAAQAQGDQRALLDAGRRVIHFHLGRDVVAGLKRLESWV